MRLVVLCAVALVVLSAEINDVLNKLDRGATITAGTSKVDATGPVGGPLAPYNFGARRVKTWPIPKFTNYTTWQVPSTGIISPIYVKALALSDGTTTIMFVTMDVVGCDYTMQQMAYDIAQIAGLTVPLNNIVFSASHTHSGPGAISTDFVFQVSPSTDVLVPELQRGFAEKVAAAMLGAVAAMKPAKIGTAIGSLTTVTVNRRADISPYVNKSSIDPNLAVIRVDDMSGNAIGTLWNFAIHGTCYYDENLLYCSEIMGLASELIEKSNGGVAFFVNADAGDIAPSSSACAGKPSFGGSPLIAAEVTKIRQSIVPTTDVTFTLASTVVDFGNTNLNATLSRLGNCSRGGPFDICGICEVLHCDVNEHLPSSWIHHHPRFTAIKFAYGGPTPKTTVMVTIPGEALLEVGNWIRSDTAALGYQETFLLGYSNNYMCYFASPREYMVGGYESAMTWWGIGTAGEIRDCVRINAQGL